MNNAYVYAVFRPDGRICYIGKGTGQRWKRHDARAKRNPHYAAILENAGGNLPVVIISSGLSDKKAYEIEALLTRIIGLEKDGGPLVNCGHGGVGGPSGVVHSAEWRRIRSLRAAEAWQKPEVRSKLLRAGRKRSGNPNPKTQEFKTAMSIRLKGNTHTLGHKASEETRAKMSAALTGKKRSTEQRSRMREAARKGWIKRRATG